MNFLFTYGIKMGNIDRVRKKSSSCSAEQLLIPRLSAFRENL